MPFGRLLCLPRGCAPSVESTTRTTTSCVPSSDATVVNPSTALVILKCVCVRAAFQQPELRRMCARVRPRVTLRLVLVLFSELFFLWI